MKIRKEKELADALNSDHKFIRKLQYQTKVQDSNQCTSLSTQTAELSECKSVTSSTSPEDHYISPQKIQIHKQNRCLKFAVEEATRRTNEF